MRRVLGLYRSSIGKKVMMAVTGVLLVGFVFGHMLGNLKAFQGAEKLDHYAEFLRVVGDPFFSYGQALWVFRIALLVAVVVHIVAAVQLTWVSRGARPEACSCKRSSMLLMRESAWKRPCMGLSFN